MATFRKTRHPEQKNNVNAPVTCLTHDKLTYASRSHARHAIRVHPRGKGMRPYQCTAIDGGWHIGHMPRSVVRGKTTAREIYG